MTTKNSAKVIYLTAGAGGMYCGSCLHDNALAKALTTAGWNVQLVPAYTPIRTDETDVSVDHVVFGGLNVYLQQRVPLFRYLPRFLDHFLDSPWLIRRVTANAMDTNPKLLGALALSMLRGEKGNQRKEVQRLCQWLDEQQPDLLVFSNILIGGCLESIKQHSAKPVLVTLQGDDVFLDSLNEPFKTQCIDRIRELVGFVDGFIVHTDFFRDRMADYFGIDWQKIHVTPLGIDTVDFQNFDPARIHDAAGSDTLQIGYLARLAPEKGLANLVDAFVELQKDPERNSELLIAGWLGPENKEYVQQQWSKLNQAGLDESYEYLGAVDRHQKLKFLSNVDIFSVPTDYLEPKGLYVLEAMAAGIPVVLPDHGAFAEIVRLSGGGLLVPPGDIQALAAALRRLIQDPELRHRLGKAGHQFVHQQRNSATMAATTAAVFGKFL